MKKSRLESCLAPFLMAMGYVRDVQIRCGAKRKQVDFVNRRAKAVVEIDGPWHFLPVSGDEKLRKTQVRDRMLETEIDRRHWSLVRVSMENFVRSGHSIKIDLHELLSIIKGHERCPGTLSLGGLYASHTSVMGTVMILK
jgi:very-short-patch-repair endonuclease